MPSNDSANNITNINPTTKTGIITRNEGETITEFLIRGNKRHIKQKPEGFYTGHKTQQPKILIHHCSDSREIVNFIFDMHPELGKIFEIENAGNVIDGSITAISALVYATKHFPIERVYVMGHSLCGAISAAASDHNNEKNKVDWPIKALLNILQNTIEITKYIVKQETGIELQTEDLLKPENEKFLRWAEEINIDYQCEFYRQVLNSIGITNIPVIGLYHDISGSFGGRKGKVYIVDGEDQLIKRPPLFEDGEDTIKKCVPYKKARQ